jgi:hypothetical protein
MFVNIQSLKKGNGDAFKNGARMTKGDVIRLGKTELEVLEMITVGEEYETSIKNTLNSLRFGQGETRKGKVNESDEVHCCRICLDD